MAKKYEINAEKMEELQSVRKRNRDKVIDRRLHALILHGEGHTGKEISAATGFSTAASPRPLIMSEKMEMRRCFPIRRNLTEPI